MSGISRAEAALPGGSLDPTQIPKYQAPLVVPPAMPRAGKVKTKSGKNIDYYEIAVRQFEQQVLPPGLPTTTVWGYGSSKHPSTFHAPSFTIEAHYGKPVRIKWINELLDEKGNYLPHLLPIDQTLHWANPTGDCYNGQIAPDCQGEERTPYLGPVPIITHVHGAHVAQQYDGYPEAWYLPQAANIPANYHREGTFYEYFEQLAAADGITWQPGSATFQYPNDQPATTLWYHDHALGITRLNVYAGPAGFYLIRGGSNDVENGVLPGPAPTMDELPGTQHYEIPIAIQDRSFNEDGSLFYPDNRAFFEGLSPEQLQISFRFDAALSGLGPSDVAPIHNPEFFGNTMMVNGRTWPYLEVEQRRYRFRLLNGAQSRFLLLELDPDGSSYNLPFWQIGAEGGFLPEPVPRTTVLMAPAERADVIVDFTELAVGTTVTLRNFGPDEPFHGGEPYEDFDPADPDTTGQVMEFRVVPADPENPDTSADPALDELELPKLPGAPQGSVVERKVSLNEVDSRTVWVEQQEDGSIIEVDYPSEFFGPVEALLGTYDTPLEWAEPITENPKLGTIEEWAIHNFTEDAHPIHVHQVQFQVIERRELISGTRSDPEPWEEGYKDTVIALPGEVTRIRARFDLPGLYTWHCHILEHEDNEMMRPYHVGPIPANLPSGH